jgi:undecaprenyl diphosphate synthase
MRICVIGDISKLTHELQTKIRNLEDMTRQKHGLRVNIALNYGGRDDIIRACKKISANVSNDRLSVNDIDETMFAAYLDTGGMPDPDLLIRTSGEMRISNFLLWQTAYTEFYFCDKLWPDFNINDLNEAIAQYQGRNRRYGARNDIEKRDTNG